ncbi:hypothetical protein RCIA14 [Methanocella arvoryzae MRE50]|uniref:Uncharacterized protein n=1 Tax=Methanocella arvoryzae (strain DSM 22066 / NBRC 105507 / MRE50) TaxID=351160 RepID=Q0W786_METAR|nr:hypothetical protein RCIA14 [Methanocella arvoryzae MRE50]
MHPQGLTVSSALRATSLSPDHRTGPRPFRCCDIATTLAVCPLQAFVCPGGGGTFLTLKERQPSLLSHSIKI